LAVSKNRKFVNGATIDDVVNVYQLAYKLDCKGVTIYRDGTRDKQVLSTGKTEDRRPAQPGMKRKRLVKRERA